MAERKANMLPMCLRNLDLDCPLDCPLHDDAEMYMEDLEQSLPFSRQEIKESMRAMDVVDKAVANNDTNLLLREMRVEEDCVNSSQAVETFIGYDE